MKEGCRKQMFSSNNKEAGFILPLTLIIMFLLSAVVLFEVRDFMHKRIFYEKQQELFTIESLLQMAAVDLVDRMNEAVVETTGTFSYEHGSAHYWMEPVTHDTVYIQMTMETNAKNKRLVRITYDVEKKKITHWWEVTKG